MKGQRNGANETLQEAQGAIVETAQMLRETASGVAGQAQQLATEAGRQASAAVHSAYDTGGDMLDVVEGFARENVWGSLLIAACLGYGVACLVKNTRR